MTVDGAGRGQACRWPTCARHAQSCRGGALLGYEETRKPTDNVVVFVFVVVVFDFVVDASLRFPVPCCAVSAELKILRQPAGRTCCGSPTIIVLFPLSAFFSLSQTGKDHGHQLVNGEARQPRWLYPHEQRQTAAWAAVDLPCCRYCLALVIAVVAAAVRRRLERV